MRLPRPRHRQQPRVWRESSGVRRVRGHVLWPWRHRLPRLRPSRLHRHHQLVVGRLPVAWVPEAVAALAVRGAVARQLLLQRHSLHGLCRPVVHHRRPRAPRPVAGAATCSGSPLAVLERAGRAARAEELPSSSSSRRSGGVGR